MNAFRPFKKKKKKLYIIRYQTSAEVLALASAVLDSLVCRRVLIFRFDIVGSNAVVICGCKFCNDFFRILPDIEKEVAGENGVGSAGEFLFFN